jgi:peptide/nickel transport system ATP-binding protein
MERCRKEMPQMIEKNGHKVRCFLYEGTAEEEKKGGQKA